MHTLVSSPRSPSSVKFVSLRQVEFMLARRWTVIVLGVFVPTSMLLIIGYTTLFVNLSLLDVSSCEGDAQGRRFLEVGEGRYEQLFEILRNLTCSFSKNPVVRSQCFIIRVVFKP